VVTVTLLLPSFVSGTTPRAPGGRSPPAAAPVVWQLPL
jgi:hypothetical protein